MERLFWISLAGAVGTAARYLITIAIAQRFGSALPYGTLFVNLTGCFAIAALVPAGAALGWSPTVRTAVDRWLSRRVHHVLQLQLRNDEVVGG